MVGISYGRNYQLAGGEALQNDTVHKRLRLSGAIVKQRAILNAFYKKKIVFGLTRRDYVTKIYYQ